MWAKRDDSKKCAIVGGKAEMTSDEGNVIIGIASQVSS